MINKVKNILKQMSCDGWHQDDLTLLQKAYDELNNINVDEEWKDVVGYEGLYQVSNLGRVKGLNRFIELKNNNIKTVKSIFLKGGKDINGYHIIRLSDNKNIHTVRVHRLVAEAFIPNSENKPEVNHIDGIKLNNNVSNLEWVTSSENSQHAYATGLMDNCTKAKNKPVLMLSKEGKPLLWFDSMTEASIETNTQKSNISNCCYGKRNLAGGHRWSFYEGDKQNG